MMARMRCGIRVFLTSGILWFASLSAAQFPLWNDSLGIRTITGSVAGRDSAGGGVVAVTHSGGFRGGNQISVTAYDRFMTRRWQTNWSGDGFGEFEAVAVATHLNGRVALLVRNQRAGQTILVNFSSTGGKLWERSVPSTWGELLPAGVSVQPNGTVLYFGVASGINGVTMARFTSTGSILSNVGINNNAPGSIVDWQFVGDSIFAVIDLGDGYAVGEFSFATNTRTWWRELSSGQPSHIAVAPGGTVYVGLMLGNPARATIHAWPDRLALTPLATQIPGLGQIGEEVQGLEALSVGGIDRVRALVQLGAVNRSLAVLSFDGDPFGLSLPVPATQGQLTLVGNSSSFSLRNADSFRQWWENQETLPYPAGIRLLGTSSGVFRGWQMLEAPGSTFVLQGIGPTRFGGWDEFQIVAGVEDRTIALVSDGLGAVARLRSVASANRDLVTLEMIERTGAIRWSRAAANTRRYDDSELTVMPNRDLVVASPEGTGVRVARIAAASGASVWSRYIELRSNNTGAQHILTTTEGDLVIVGSSDNWADLEMFAVRLSAAGNLTWRTFYSNGAFSQVSGAVLDATNNLVVGGYFGTDYHLASFSAQTGAFRWRSTAPVGAGRIFRTVDNAIVGLTADNGPRRAVKVSANGATVWEREIAFDGITSLFMETSARLANGNFLFVGNGRNASNQNRMVFAILNPAGTILFRRIVEPTAGRQFSDEGFQIVTDPSGLFHIPSTEGWVDGVQRQRPVVLTFAPNGQDVARRFSLATTRGAGSLAAAGLDGELFFAGIDVRPTKDQDIFLLRERYNVRPVAVANAYTVTRGQTLTVPAAGVLANDTNPVPGTTLTAAVVAPAPAGLTLNPNGGFTFRAPATTGIVRFQYQAVQGPNRSTPATVTITVQ